MSKHTAAPWYVERVGELNIYVRSSSEHGARVVKIEILTKPTEEEDLANANLVAAAPVLLEAAILGLSISESWINEQYSGERHKQANEALNPIRYAISKARGEV